MSENEMRKAMLKQDLSGVPNPAAEILRKDRRVMRMLIGCTIFFWFLAGAGITLLYTFLIVIIAPKMNQLLAHPENSQRNVDAWRWVFRGWFGIAHPVIVASLISFFLAALATVALIYMSRRATLRQVNATLADISLQLRQMQRP